MNATIWAVFIAMTLMIAVATLGRRFGHLKRAYYFGISLWSQWLPVFATGAVLALLAANIAAGDGIEKTLDLSKHFSLFEMIVFFVLGPLYLTKVGNVLATATVCYMLQRLLLGSGTFAPAVSVYLLTGSVTLVAILGDKMPWHGPAQHNPTAAKLRELLLALLTIGALGVTFASVLKIHAFARWLTGAFALDIPAIVVLFVLVTLMIGWMSVGLGFTRHFTIPLLSLPTMFALAYVTSWPSHLLVIPFAMCLALSLATAERRMGGRRRRTGVVAPTHYALR